MRRVRTTALLLAAFVVAWLALPISSFAAGPSDDHVVIVLAPYLSWSDVTPTSTPTLWSLAEKGAVADINARSRNREPGEAASPLEGALTISAGTWALHTKEAPAAYTSSERYEVGTAEDAFERVTGYAAAGNRVLFLGIPMTERQNEQTSFEVSLGALGESVRRAGGVTAAVGNSDIGYESSEPRRMRPAALAAMDSMGRVQYGDVSRRMLEENPDAPFGIQTDLRVFEQTLEGVRERVDESDGPSLVVLDPGDMYRATKFSPQVSPAIAERQHAQALGVVDEVAAMASEHFGDGTVMVVSQSTGDPLLGEREGLGPVILAGSGWSGYLTSNSTQRTGLVTNPDVSATVLALFGLDRPVEMIGNPMRPQGASSSIESRVERLSRMAAAAVAVDAARPGVLNGFVALTVVALALSAIVIVRSRTWPARLREGWVRSLQAVFLFVLVVPMSGWLMFAWMPAPATLGSVLVAIGGTAIVLWALALLLWWRSALRVPVAVVSLATVAVVLVDQWLGAPASFTNMFGYSPLLAARFYGMGNESAAIVFGASVVGSAMLLDQWPESRFAASGRRYGLPVLGLLVVFTAAAPFFGANIAVAVWGLAGFGLAWVLMNGRRVTWKLVLLAAIAVAVFVAVFALIDLYGGGEQTHLGRALVSASQGGFGELWTIVSRKAETNARVLTRTNWAYILIATLGFLALMRWRPRGDFAETLNDNPCFADAITVSLVAAAIAYFTEDSGIVISALVVFYVGVALAWLMLSRLPQSEAHEIAGGREVSGL